MKTNSIFHPTIKTIAAAFVAVSLIESAHCAEKPASPQLADWTIMIFLNADNNLEQDALNNFADIAKIGSTDKVNIVVQFDRNGNYATTNPQWTQTLRFLVKKGMVPTPSTAVQDIGEADMGDGAVLKAFVDWAKEKYPARHYFLEIWDHGQGWRVMMRSSLDEFRAAAPEQPRRSAAFRSVSVDDTNGGNQLYNRKIQDALSGYGLDLIGFDACLMSMVETAYALRGVAHVMVGSEELEPGEGWKYDDWLKKLQANPSMDAVGLGSLLVDSYKRTYGDNDATTLSAIDLSKAEGLATAVSALGDQLETELQKNPSVVTQARTNCAVYAPNTFGDGRDYFQHIDLGYFCDQLHGPNRNSSQVKEAADQVRAAVKGCVLANYASKQRMGAFGSTGLAIYFPKSGAIYKGDPYQENGYEKDNQNYPVEFVQKFHWGDFLHQYFAKVPN